MNRYGWSDYSDFLMEPASDRSSLTIWGWGVAVPLVISSYAISCIASQSATFIQSRPARLIEYTGASATAIGCGYLSIALFMYCHYVWSSHERYHGFGMLGKMLSLIALIGSVIGLVACNLNVFRL